MTEEGRRKKKLYGAVGHRYIYIGNRRQRQAERQRKRDTKTDIETERHRNRHRDIKTARNIGTDIET